MLDLAPDPEMLIPTWSLPEMRLRAPFATAADDVGRGAVNADANRVGDGLGSGDIRADEIAFDGVPGCPAAR